MRGQGDEDERFLTQLRGARAVRRPAFGVRAFGVRGVWRAGGAFGVRAFGVRRSDRGCSQCRKNTGSERTIQSSTRFFLHTVHTSGPQPSDGLARDDHPQSIERLVDERD
jgi:hypothetical protein